MTLRTLYGIRDSIARSGRLVLDLGQLSNLALLPRHHARVYASRMVKKGLASRVLEGVISLTDDPFIVATQLVEPSYVSFTSALYLRGMLQQVPVVVECVTTKNSLRQERLGIVYHRMAPGLFMGYERMERYGSYVMVALPEKAVLDMIYYGLEYDISDLALDRRRLSALAAYFVRRGGPRGRRVGRWVEGVAR